MAVSSAGRCHASYPWCLQAADFEYARITRQHESFSMTLTRTHKILVLIALYLAQGLPYGFFTQALPVLMRDAGYSLKAISAAGLLYLPWALKFLWAPYLDH